MKTVKMRLFFIDRHWRSKTVLFKLSMSSSQLHDFVLIFAWTNFSFVDTLLISFWFLSQILETFVIWSLFFLHSTFKLSKRLLTPCILPSSSVTFALHVFTPFSTVTSLLVKMLTHFSNHQIDLNLFQLVVVYYQL